MKRISFGLTIDQFLAGSKDVTRRSGWASLRPGDRLLAVDRVMGFKRGEKSRALGVIEVVSARRERLDAITDDDVRREGFPDLDAAGFVAFYARAMGGDGSQEVTRIEFRRVAGDAGVLRLFGAAQ